MATNDFVPFATGAGANIYSTQTYRGLNARQIGVVDGEADPKLANNSWRQASVMASMIGAFIADNGFDALDNGDLDGLKTAFKSALSGQYGPALVHYASDSSTSPNSVQLTSVSPVLTGLTSGTVIVFVPANTNTANVTAQITVAGAVQTVPIVARSGVDLASGDMIGGRPLFAIVYGGALRILTALASELITTIVNSGQVVVPRDSPVLYVRTDGNDINDGSINDAAHALQTVPAAINKLRRQYAFSSALIQLGNPGTYTGLQYVPTLAGVLNIVGDPNNQLGYNLQGAGSPGQGSIQTSSPVNLTGLTVVNTGTQSHTIAATASQVTLTNVGLVSTNGTTGYHAYAPGGRVLFAAGCSISGNAAAALTGESGGEVAINPQTVLSVNNSPSFLIAFALAQSQGRISALGGSSVFGSATGVRYIAQTYGIISTNGGGPNFFPGSASGTANNGLYI